MQNVIALDIGGTNIRVAIIDENLNILKVIRRSTVIGSINLFLEQVSSIIDEIEPESFHVSAIAAGVPGRVRWDGFIDALPNVHIDNIPLREYLEARYKVPTFIKNDAEVAGLAEGIAGAGKDYRSSFFITISTGIGGALVVDKKLKNSSYEIGHTLFNYRGNYYEIEKIASGQGISKLLELNAMPQIPAYQFFEHVATNDEVYLLAYADWLSLLSAFIRFIQGSFEPDIIVLTGGVMKSSTVFFNDLQMRNAESLLAHAHFDQDAGLIGAACYAFSMLK
jgi:glucokinase